MKILITGDFVITEEYSKQNISKEVVELFKNSDFNIVNLEAPVTSSLLAIDKTGPNLKAHNTSTKNILSLLEVDLVTLANNHILDFDEKGVKETLSFCDNNNIHTVGAGMNIEKAIQNFFINSSEGKIAIVNFCENEWTSATNNSAGANPMDFIDNTKQIESAKKEADFIIVIVHGGNEYNRYPSPRMVKQYRYYADCGADLIVGHHPHCISGFEVYNKTPILYSLGNFLFTMDSPKDVWYNGIIASIELTKDEKIKFDLIPVEQSRDNFRLSLPEKVKKEGLLNEIKEINNVISNPQELEVKWKEFVLLSTSSFIKTLTPVAGINNRYLKAFLYRSGMYRSFLNRRYLKESLNRIRCEAHLDVTKEIFKNLLNK